MTFPQKCVPKILGMVKKSINSTIYDFKALSGWSEVIIYSLLERIYITSDPQQLRESGNGKIQGRHIGVLA